MNLLCRLPAALVTAPLLLVVALGGCDGCGQQKPTIPDSPDGRLDELTSALPAETGAVAAVGDLESFETQGKNLTSATDSVAPSSGLVGRTLKSQIGVNPLKLDAITSSGIAEDGAAALALYDGHPVVLAYVDDRQAFEKSLSNRVEEQLGLESSVETTKRDDYRMKTLQKKGVGQVSWAYDDKLAIVVFPAVLTAQEATPPTVTRTLSTIFDTDPKKSFARNEDFEGFRKASSDHRAFAFLSTDWYFSEETARRLGAQNPESLSSLYESLRNQLEGLGLVGRAAPKRIRANLRLGLADEAAKRFRTVDETDAHTDWSRLATDQTLFALRSSEDFSAGWKSFQNHAPKRYRLVARRLLDLPAPFGEFDVQKQVLESFTGQAGLFFYGIGPNLSLGRAASSPGRTLGQMGVVAGFQFDSPDALRSAAESLAALDDRVSLRPLDAPDEASDSSIRVLECSRSDDGDGSSGGDKASDDAEAEEAASNAEKPPPGIRACLDWPLRAYLHEDLLVVASTAISESSMHGYLTGTRQDARALTEADGLDLGGDVAATEDVSGLYFNFVRAKSHLGDKLPPLPALQSALDGLQELLVSFGGSDGAVELTATVDMKGQGSDDSGTGSEDAGDD